MSSTSQFFFIEYVTPGVHLPCEWHDHEDHIEHLDEFLDWLDRNGYEVVGLQTYSLPTLLS